MLKYYWRRIGSFVIDMSVISMFISIIMQYCYPIFQLTLNDLGIDILKIMGYLIFLVLISVLYNMICYRFFKFTLGKLLLSVKVLNENKERCTMKQYFLREWNKYCLIYATLGLYVLYQFVAKVMKQKVTYHEKVSNTYTFI